MSEVDDPVMMVVVGRVALNLTEGPPRGYTSTRIVGGKRIVERTPALCASGLSSRAKQHPRAAVRALRVVRGDGHEISLVLTNGAAHLDTRTEWADYQRAKARHLGWYQLDGPCVARLLSSGTMTREHFKSAIVDEQACGAEARGCKHNHVELAARRAYRSDEAEAVENAAAAQARRGDAHIAEVVASAIGAALAAEKGKKKK